MNNVKNNSNTKEKGKSQKWCKYCNKDTHDYEDWLWREDGVCTCEMLEWDKYGREGGGEFELK